jgi:hypothetical protein
LKEPAMSHQPASKKAPGIRPLPDDVLRLLRAQAQRTTSVQLAEQLGVSPSAVSQAMHDKYRGNVERFCARVRGLWGGDTVQCPVLGAINTKVCTDQQGKPLAFTNPLRVALSKACKACPHASANTAATSTPTGANHE